MVSCNPSETALIGSRRRSPSPSGTTSIGVATALTAVAKAATYFRMYLIGSATRPMGLLDYTQSRVRHRSHLAAWSPNFAVTVIEMDHEGATDSLPISIDHPRTEYCHRQNPWWRWLTPHGVSVPCRTSAARGRQSSFLRLAIAFTHRV